VKKKADRRVQRTRQLLEAALLSLIKEKPFDTISVQEIIDRANVGRATFYAHYENKVDLLATGFEGLELALRERQREARSRETNPDERLFAFSHALLAHAHEHREVFPAMLGKRGGAVIQHALRNLLVQLIREEVKTTSSRGSADSIPAEAIVQFIAGGLFGLLTWWLNGKTKLSVQDANRIFRRLSIPTLKAALR
jgi:AcrR family transcriptional regulator